MIKRLLSVAALTFLFAFVQASIAQTVPQATGLDSGNSDANAEHPLFFQIGGARFTPGGFLDFTNIFRSTNVGSLGTNFYSIPFNNAEQAHITEDKLTAQNSRLSLQADDKFGENKIGGYVEADFLGNDAANANVTSNSHTFRMRLYFVQFQRGKVEVDAGQMWGWLTPNRKGLSPYPADVFYTDNEDFNYQVGLTWTRQPAFRVILHPVESLALGFSVENPDMYGGQSEVTFPAAFNAQLGLEIDEGTISTTAPNWFPDLIPKIAWDSTGRLHQHVELAGLISGFNITDLPEVTGATFVNHSKIGVGGSAAVNFELAPNLHFVSNAYWSDGGGRYIFGMAPDVIAVPVSYPGNTCGVVSFGPGVSAAEGCDLLLSPVHSGSGTAGFEAKASPLFTLFAYYGGMYAQRNTVLDITSTAAVPPHIGFGGPSSANSNNRTIQEPTLGWILAFWSHPQRGTLELISQESYLTRSPWFVAAGAPKNAHLVMSWFDLRYVLP